MKKIFYSLLALATLSLVGCSGDNNPNEGKFHADPEAGYVYFSNPGMTVNIPVGCAEEAGEVSIPFLLNAYVNKNGLNVQYSITEIEGSSDVATVEAMVPAGSLEGNITVAYPAGLTSTVAFDVVFTGTSNNSVEIGAPESTVEQKVTVRLNVDTRDLLLGNYDVIETVGGDQETHTSTILPGSADDEILITGLGYFYAADLDDALENSTVRAFVNADGTLSFPDAIDNYAFDNESVGPLYFEGNSGEYTACPGDLSINYTFRFGANLASAVNPIDVVLVRQ
ncbi:hypothetical protein GCM10007424_15080 [Flavobacterium suaedae]|uniref:DUF1735 domain-containing protein n=1 Tax=Flavobacterium suaedae TaxID=1767027 RepID=A0ABQ1JTN6_9FLAO|nr:hypothetical protein [Flavobacterium suaedae]GGB76081.1 hypothetical protein GCM10007424_15080 [Flavobacterium suaedae]